MIVPETRVAVALLVDTSASASPADLQKASETARAMASARGRNWLRVIPFARSTRPLNPGEEQKNWRLVSTSGDAGRAPDIEGAIQEAIASVTAGMVPRIFLSHGGAGNQGHGRNGQAANRKDAGGRVKRQFRACHDSPFLD